MQSKYSSSNDVYIYNIYTSNTISLLLVLVILVCIYLASFRNTKAHSLRIKLF